MMMSGKQFSLDSRIDLAEAVDQANEDTQDITEQEPDDNSRGRSLSVIENSEVAGQVN